MKARFNVYEIEHDGDVERSADDLRRAGCWQIEVTHTDFDAEFMVVECQLPEGVSSPNQLSLTVACL